MKKLLGFLGTITIAGSGMAGLVGNAPAPAKKEINYLQTNNLENLKRDKRYVKNVEGIDYRWGTTHYHTLLYIKIKKESWATIYNKYDNLSTKEFKEYLENFVSMMHRDDRVAGNDYNNKIFNILLNKIENINNCYASLPNNVGLDIIMRSNGEFHSVGRQ